MRRARRKGAGAGVLALGAGVAVAVAGCFPAPGPAAARGTGRSIATADIRESRGSEVADAGWTLRTRRAESVRLGDLRGQPVLVNLWATWCPPCVQEISSLERLAARVRDTRVAFLLVTTEEPAHVEGFLASNPVALPVLFEETLAPEAFGPVVLPTTVVLDARGRIVLRHRGATAWDTDEVERLLRALDGEATR